MSRKQTDNTQTTDPRFKIAHREAIIGLALAVFNFVWWFGFAYGLGSRSPEDYTYIWGLPDWFFYSCVLGFIIMCILVIVITKFVLKEVPLDAEPSHMDQPKEGPEKQ
ncbi:YhdT family protein [Sporosarcina sp. Te-1]|uniref:YhdT family protein n=1 Tax=Sporosarcina sp. Te-1 TaxID=2818390 RepID=UPI001A9EF4FF|nr:YhdT family protein [Sporosarcina sp. Te-1]QTD40796.1 YhdT family protein [Sporosarcina sp. Te-1]